MRARGAPRPWAAATFALAALALFVPAGCEQILDVPERTAVVNLTCAGGVCSCEEAYGDCKGGLSDGCETPLMKSSEHCGACGHSCDGGTCVDGVCEPVLMRVGEAIAGPVVSGDFVYVVDRDTGALLRSPTSGAPDFKIFRENPAPKRVEADLFAGADGLYVLLEPYFTSDPGTELLFVDAAGNTTAPFGKYAGGSYSNVGVAATSDAIYVNNGPDVLRIDRSTLAQTVVTDRGRSRVLVRGDDAFVLIDGTDADGIHALPHGGGAPVFVFRDEQHTACNAWGTSSGFVLWACTSHLLRLFDASGNLVGEADGFPLDVIEDGGLHYWLDDDAKELDAFDGVEATTVAESQPFPSEGTFRIATSGTSLFWGSKNGVSRLVR